MIDSFKIQFRLIFNDTELADTVILMDHRISYSQHRIVPLIEVSAIRLINDAHMIRLDNAPLLKGGTAGHYMSLISFREFHRDAKRDQLELTCLQLAKAGNIQIDGISFIEHLSFRLSTRVYALRTASVCSRSS